MDGAFGVPLVTVDEVPDAPLGRRHGQDGEVRKVAAYLVRTLIASDHGISVWPAAESLLNGFRRLTTHLKWRQPGTELRSDATYLLPDK